MPIFNIIFNDHSSKEVEAKDKEDLIRNFCLVDATAFQEDVKEIHWDENGFCYIETISTGKIKKTALVDRN